MKKTLQILTTGALLNIALCLSAQNDTVFHFSFDGNLNDVSGNNVVITDPTGTGTFFNTSSPGVNGNALFLDGTDGTYLHIAEAGLLDPAATDFTVCAWVKCTSELTHPAEHIILHQTHGDGGAGATRWLLGLHGVGPNGTDSLRLATWVGAGITTSTDTVVRNEWVHVAVVGTTADSTVTFYINGEQKGSSVAPNAFEASTQGFFIGKHRGTNAAGNAKTWWGYIDDLYLLSKALNADDINNVAGISSAPDAINTSEKSVVAIYPNPFKDVLNVTNAVKIEMYNLAGAKMLEVTGSKLNVSGIKNGIYMIRATTSNNETINRKVIIE